MNYHTMRRMALIRNVWKTEMTNTNPPLNVSDGFAIFII